MLQIHLVELGRVVALIDAPNQGTVALVHLDVSDDVRVPRGESAAWAAANSTRDEDSIASEMRLFIVFFCGLGDLNGDQTKKKSRGLSRVSSNKHEVSKMSKPQNQEFK